MRHAPASRQRRRQFVFILGGVIDGDAAIKGIGHGFELVADVVEVPGRWAVTVVLGGQQRDTLYCATARTTLEDFHLGRATAAIETLRVDVPGF